MLSCLVVVDEDSTKHEGGGEEAGQDNDHHPLHSSLSPCLLLHLLIPVDGEVDLVLLLPDVNVSVLGAVGGAVDMVTAADCRYATEDAWFCIQEINIGMTADVGTLQRLPKLIPDGVIRELAYTGDRMPAQRAKEVGLVNEVYADQATMLEDVLGIAGRIASKSPLAVYGSKQSIVYARDHSVADSLNQIATWQTGMFQPRDMMESFQAQMEKREPEFDDLNPVRRGLA